MPSLQSDFPRGASELGSAVGPSAGFESQAGLEAYVSLKFKLDNKEWSGVSRGRWDGDQTNDAVRWPCRATRAWRRRHRNMSNLKILNDAIPGFPWWPYI